MEVAALVAALPEMELREVTMVEQQVTHCQETCATFSAALTCYLDGASRRMRRTAEYLHGGLIAPATFRRWMVREIVRAHLGACLLGAGGRAALAPVQLARCVCDVGAQRHLFVQLADGLMERRRAGLPLDAGDVLVLGMFAYGALGTAHQVRRLAEAESEVVRCPSVP